MVASKEDSPSRSAGAAGEKEVGGDAGMVRSWSPLGKAVKMRQHKSMFKQFPHRVASVSSHKAPAGQAAASSCTFSQDADSLAERLGTLMVSRVSLSSSGSCKELLGNRFSLPAPGKGAGAKRFALEKRRPSLRLRREKSPPPSLSFDQVEHSLDGGWRKERWALIDISSSPTATVVECPSVPSAPRSKSTSVGALLPLLMRSPPRDEDP